MKCGLRLVTTSTEDLCDSLQCDVLPTGVSIVIGDNQFLMLDCDYQDFKSKIEETDKEVNVKIVYLDIPAEFIS